MKLSFFITLGILTNIFYSSSALGDDLVLDAEVSSDDVAVLYGSACEKINSQEPKSSVRIRATDKASFDAVKNLSDLSEFKSQYNEHDFNVLVYNIVDNYIDDLTVRTTKQDDKEICVEVTGYVKKADILSSINHDENKDAEKNIVAESLSLDEEATLTEENKNINEIDAQEIVPSVSVTVKERSEISSAEDNKKLLYVAPVEFFNNTFSESHKKILSDIFINNNLFYLTDKKDTADYIISSKVMRAKVDPINSNTNRMQMVISVGVEFTDSGESTVEHQNRFILFSSDESEQDVANKLMKKLLRKAGELILKKVENNAEKTVSEKNNFSIITPK